MKNEKTLLKTLSGDRSSFIEWPIKPKSRTKQFYLLRSASIDPLRVCNLCVMPLPLIAAPFKQLQRRMSIISDDWPSGHKHEPSSG